MPETPVQAHTWPYGGLPSIVRPRLGVTCINAPVAAGAGRNSSAGDQCFKVTPEGAQGSDAGRIILVGQLELNDEGAMLDHEVVQGDGGKRENVFGKFLCPGDAVRPALPDLVVAETGASGVDLGSPSACTRPAA